MKRHQWANSCNTMLQMCLSLFYFLQINVSGNSQAFHSKHLKSAECLKRILQNIFLIAQLYFKWKNTRIFEATVLLLEETIKNTFTWSCSSNKLDKFRIFSCWNTTETLDLFCNALEIQKNLRRKSFHKRTLLSVITWLVERMECLYTRGLNGNSRFTTKPSGIELGHVSWRLPCAQTLIMLKWKAYVLPYWGANSQVVGGKFEESEYNLH